VQAVWPRGKKGGPELSRVACNKGRLLEGGSISETSGQENFGNLRKKKVENKVFVNLTGGVTWPDKSSGGNVDEGEALSLCPEGGGDDEDQGA